MHHVTYVNEYMSMNRSVITTQASSKRALAFAPKGNQPVVQVRYDGYRSHRGLSTLGLFIDVYLTRANWSASPILQGLRI